MIVVIPACNEAETIGRTIESALVMPDARVLVVDMASTDLTPKIAHDMGISVVPAPALERYDDAYNRAIVEASRLCLDGADWIIFLRARRVLSGEWFGSMVRAGAVSARYRHGDVEWRGPVAWRRASGACFRGATHEELITTASDVDSGLTVTTLDAPHPRPAKERWERDLRLLEGDDSPRGRFYYAQTLECLGRKEEAFLAYTARLARADGWREELYVSARRMVSLEPSLVEAASYVRVAGVANPHRGEAMLALGHRYFAVGDYHSALTAATSALLMHQPDPGALFVEFNLPWQAEEMRALCFDKLGEPIHARAAFELAKQKKSEIA